MWRLYRWYDGLPESKRFLAFLGIMMIAVGIVVTGLIPIMIYGDEALLVTGMIFLLSLSASRMYYFRFGKGP